MGRCLRGWRSIELLDREDTFSSRASNYLKVFGNTSLPPVTMYEGRGTRGEGGADQSSTFVYTAATLFSAIVGEYFMKTGLCVGLSIFFCLAAPAFADDSFEPLGCSGSRTIKSPEICTGKSMCYCGGEGFSFSKQGLTEAECKAHCLPNDYHFVPAADVNNNTLKALCNGLSNIMTGGGTCPAPCHWRRRQGSEGPVVSGNCCSYQATDDCVA